MREAKPFSTDDLDRLGLDRFQTYLDKHGWRDCGNASQRPDIWVYRNVESKDDDTVLILAGELYGDWYVRFAQAIADLAAFEGESLVRMYLKLTLGI